MIIRIAYYSGYKGNTKKIAAAMAEMLNIKAERIGKDKIVFSEPVDLLFIGSGVYFNRPHKKAARFIKNLHSSLIKNAAVFGTYGNQANIGEQIIKLLQEQGIKTLGEPFACKGDSVETDNKERPNAIDLENAKAFAENIVAII